MQVNPMVNTLVQHIMVNEEDIGAWRRNLIQNQIFDAQEVKDLSEREISLIHHALLVQKFSQMSSEDLNREIENHDVQYHLNLETDDFQMGAVAY